MKVIRSVKEMQETAENLRKEHRIGLVPTMGYLHEGHVSLARKAKELADVVVVSIFVNPTQFGPNEDLDRYPRDLGRDLDLLEKVNVDIVFHPGAGDVYPDNYSTYIEVRGITDHLCGKSRTGHFVGVATVVTKLFNMVKPHFAVFGQKDYQQLKVIERMVRDLNMDIEIVPYPTVRERDGLAMSSRNTYLNAGERSRALRIQASIQKAQELFSAGERRALLIKDAVRNVLESGGGVEIEYVSITDTESLEDLEILEDKALLAIACRVGRTRLIDNAILLLEA